MQTKFSSYEDESGFTLVELLVVILIIGILSAVAIPAFLNQRKSAAEASVKTDLVSTAKEMETQFIKTKTYPATVPASVIKSDGVSLSIKPADGSVAVPVKSASGQAADILFRIQSGAYQLARYNNQITQDTLINFSRTYKCTGQPAAGPYNGSLNLTVSPTIGWGSLNGQCGAVAMEYITIGPSTGTVYSNDVNVIGSHTIYPGVTGPTTDGFCLEGKHAGEPSNIWKYDSKNGGLKQGTC